MTDRIGKPISQRQLRVGEMIRQSLSMIFIRNEAKVPNLETNTITVTEVKMTTIEAWYTLQIPVSSGPAEYWGLPGLILEVNSGNTTILCSKIILNPNVYKEEKEEVKPKGPNIQDRLNERMSECLGELEGRFDDFITTSDFKGEPKVLELLTQFNVQPAQLKSALTLA